MHTYHQKHMVVDDEDDLLIMSTPVVANKIGSTPNTMAAWRAKRRIDKCTGPPFIEMPNGRIGYLKTEVIKWVQKHSK